MIFITYFINFSYIFSININTNFFFFVQMMFHGECMEKKNQDNYPDHSFLTITHVLK
jgi:hypothetical protein